jgi:hypothetical protein
MKIITLVLIMALTATGNAANPAAHPRLTVETLTPESK